VLGRPNTGVVVSNPARDMYVCVYVRYFRCVLPSVGTGFAMGRFPVYAVLPTCLKGFIYSEVNPIRTILMGEVEEE